MRRFLVLSLLFVNILTACSGERPSATDFRNTPGSEPVVDSRPVILAFGDSLTAGHGVEPSASYPEQLQRELDRLGYGYRVINAGVSGETTGAGLSRLDSALEIQPRVVILELGANDGLRGLPIRATSDNLRQMIMKCQEAGAVVLLAGMTLPLNYGPDYIRDFENTYRQLAEESGAVRIPFFLEGVAARSELNQSDGIHPTGQGYTIVTGTVLRYLLPVLKKP